MSRHLGKGRKNVRCIGKNRPNTREEKKQTCGRRKTFTREEDGQRGEERRKKAKHAVKHMDFINHARPFPQGGVTSPVCDAVEPLSCFFPFSFLLLFLLFVLCFTFHPEIII